MALHEAMLARSAALLLVMQLFAACSNPIDPEPPATNPIPKPPTLAVTAIENLEPGRVAKVVGNNLDQLATLVVDGRTVEFQIVSAREATFATPKTRDCDTDGRSIQVVANETAQASGRLSVAPTISLNVGESRVISAQELRCLQIGRGSEDYVLSVANHSRQQVIDNIMSLRLNGGHGTWSTGSAMAGLATHGTVSSAPAPDGISPTAAGQPSQTKTWTPADAFDNYAGAKVGDVVTMVDWSNSAWAHAKTKAEVPTYKAHVVAVAGSQMVIVDTRLPDAETLVSASSKAMYQKAAQMVDQHGMKAIREVIDTDFAPPGGAGGRALTIITQLNHEGGGVRDEDLVPAFQWASGMITVQLSPGLNDAKVVAGVMNHEMAHAAETWTARQRGRGVSTGWYGEALAVTVEDVAARIATGHAQQAPLSALSRADVPASSIGGLHSLTAAREPAWGKVGNPYGHGTGNYDRGARILRFAQEAMAQKTGKPSDLHSTLREAVPWGATAEPRLVAFGLDKVAQTIGMTADELLEKSMLASLTDDQVAGPHNLPQIRAWNSAPSTPGAYEEFAPAAHIIDRAQAGTADIRVAGGGYMHWYIKGNTSQGLTAEMTRDSMTPNHQVRLTRLR